jgi:hypothetical protein
MKRCVISFVAIAALFAYGAAAAEKKTPPELDPKVCQQMATYHPDSSMQSPDYQPGMDVHGKPVVEADITPNVIKAPETYSFDITVDLAEYIGLAAPVGIESKESMGQIVIDKDGHMTFNGKPLEGEAEKTLRDLCAPKPPEPKPAQNNHNQ